MFCQKCGYNSIEPNDFIMSAEATVCLTCAEVLTAAAEGKEVMAPADMTVEQPEDVSDTEGVSMTITKEDTEDAEVEKQ
jgi:hypothetical protein